ncbi:MSMP protein, partial [Amia calva]|nr:MSMP protein [Amia calva]
MGDTWMTSDCYQCVCLDPFGVGCCDHGQRPVDYPEWCEVISKPESCSVAVVMRANHKIPCLEGVGRSGRLRGGDQRPSWKTSNDPLF